MSPTLQAALRSWSIPPAATFAIVVSALIYLRGWWLLRRAGLPYLPPWRAISFVGGLLALWIALASPMDVLNGFVLTAHMLQHMFLMMLVPPLLLLGAPLVPMVRGLPVFAAREFAGPFLNWSVAQRIGRGLTNPIVALILMGAAMFAWHVPAAYELALRSSAWHQTEHACFLATSILFWWPVVQPWPSHSRWPRWAMVPYLLVADLQNTALSAVLIFSDRVLYASYSTAPRLFGLSASQDQVAAGAIMWVLGSVAFLIPAVVITVRYLSRRSAPVKSLGRKSEPAFDLFGLRSRGAPQIGGLLRQRYKPKSLEVISFVVLFTVAGLLFARLLTTGSDDDALLRSQGTSGRLAVAVFANPGDLEVGPAEVSILVQDRKTQEVLLNANVEVSAHPVPESTASPISPTQARHEDSENKLLQSVALNLSSAGEWSVLVEARHGPDVAQLQFPVHVVPAEANGAVYWPYIVFLGIGLGLTGVYGWRHRKSATRELSPETRRTPHAPRTSDSLR